MRNESRVPDDFFFFLIKFVTRPARGYRARENFSSRHDVHKSSAGRVDVRLWKVKICIGTYTGILNCSMTQWRPPSRLNSLCRCCTTGHDLLSKRTGASRNLCTLSNHHHWHSPFVPQICQQFHRTVRRRLAKRSSPELAAWRKHSTFNPRGSGNHVPR